MITSKCMNSFWINEIAHISNFLVENLFLFLLTTFKNLSNCQPRSEINEIFNFFPHLPSLSSEICSTMPSIAIIEEMDKTAKKVSVIIKNLWEQWGCNFFHISCICTLQICTNHFITCHNCRPTPWKRGDSTN